MIKKRIFRPFCTNIYKIFIGRKTALKGAIMQKRPFTTISEIGRRAMLVFRAGMSVVCIALAVIALLFCRDACVDALKAAHYYAPMLEYIAMTFLIVFTGSLLFDIAERYYEK
jgi:hypothetical protein